MCCVEVSGLRRGSFDGSVPWRRVRSAKGHRHHPGEYASATTRGLVVYESRRLELARLLLADFDPQVVGIYAQPCRLRARVGGRWRLHVPDFLLVLADGNVRVVNVKPADRLLDPKIAEALAWPGELVEGHGWQYEVWSGADPVLLANVRFLAAYRWAGVVPDEEIQRAWETVRDGDPLAVAERRLAAGRPVEDVRPAVLALVWSGRLSVDLTRPVDGDSVLRRAM
ncbi:TnsA endonuclease N terminal [Streptomyces sp. DvalAA-14]|uniref:TnsA-like heteromeric transposase endonuclease subunit n=1 Tax=unclassified Streptomyces TaxID=2593676 RepID=UPI00081BC463|nr:TnsA endonuclease N terminal [Streptomyces sp. DvalAA-14]